MKYEQTMSGPISLWIALEITHTYLRAPNKEFQAMFPQSWPKLKG